MQSTLDDMVTGTPGAMPHASGNGVETEERVSIVH